MKHLILLALLQTVPPATPADPAPPERADTLLLEPDSADLATAYADDATRQLVRRARLRRDALDESVFHYQATGRQRVSVGIQALRRDRLLFRREAASRIDWWRDRPSTVTVLGAREAVPIAFDDVRLPDDITDWARDFVPRPGDDRLWVSPTGGGFAWHPLVEGGEALYRYATGDTTVIRLPDGREYRLVELRVTPRERDPRRITGSFWIELDDYAIVQAIFRPARAFDLERDLDAMGEGEDLDDVPGLLKPITFDIRYITVEYGLWEMRWWMPRLQAFEGHVRMGAVRVPVSVALSFSDYVVEADRHGLSTLPPVVRKLAGVPGAETQPDTYPTRVVVPDDTAALLRSEYLPPSIFMEGQALITESELRQLARRIGDLPAPPWEARPPRITPPWRPGSGLLRYNRVEGLSAGARVDWDLGRARLDLTGRLGSADLEPRGELGIETADVARSLRLAGYHRLASMDPSIRPLGLGNSILALAIGRDDGLYMGATGVELRMRPTPGSGSYDLRLYAERQEPVAARTGFSLDDPGGGAPLANPPADRVDQLGAALRLDLVRGLDPAGFRWAVWLDATAETGDATFFRPGGGVSAAAPLLGGLLGAAEAAAGTTWHDGGGSSLQSRWFVGGPASLRGFRPGSLTGPDLARTRVEIATELPVARLSVFSDAAWAGRFPALRLDQAGLSAGIGASLLDGLLRVDLARALRPTTGWRIELHLDAIF